MLVRDICERMPGVTARTGRGRLWLDGPIHREALSRAFGVVSFSPVVPMLSRAPRPGRARLLGMSYRRDGYGHLRSACETSGYPSLLSAGEGSLSRRPDRRDLDRLAGGPPEQQRPLALDAVEGAALSAAGGGDASPLPRPARNQGGERAGVRRGGAETGKSFAVLAAFSRSQRSAASSR